MKADVWPRTRGCVGCQEELMVGKGRSGGIGGWWGWEGNRRREKKRVGDWRGYTRRLELVGRGSGKKEMGDWGGKGKGGKGSWTGKGTIMNLQ